MIKYFIATIAIVALGVACKSKKHTTKENTVKETTVSDSSRITVSFFSPGSGINRDAYKKLESYITRFETDNSLTITVYKIAWGREGEVDFCFNLSNIDKKKAENFVAGVKNLLTGADRVNIKENCNCREVPKR